MKKIVVIADTYRKSDHMLLDTLSNENTQCEIFYLQDITFLPQYQYSVYEYYLTRQETAPLQEKDLYYVFIEVPEFWEIQSRGVNGAILHQGVIKAMVYFRDPQIARLVERVEWQTESGHVYKIDYYNRYGWVYASAFTNDSGDIISKAYYDSQRQELINVNFSNGTVTLFEHGKIKTIYHSVEQFEEMLMRNLIEEADVVVDATASKADLIATVAGEQGTSLMTWDNKIPYSRENYPVQGEGRDAFVLTASDMIFGLEQLIESLPNIRFHVAARTAMSSKLMNLKDVDNVYLYPCIEEENIEKLLQRCDYYLDCNYLNEVDDIIARASYHNLLILAYDEWMHNRDYVLDELICGRGEVESMVQMLENLSLDSNLLAEMMRRQQQKVRQVIRTIME